MEQTRRTQAGGAVCPERVLKAVGKGLWCQRGTGRRAGLAPRRCVRALPCLHRACGALGSSRWCILNKVSFSRQIPASLSLTRTHRTPSPCELVEFLQLFPHLEYRWREGQNREMRGK